MPRKKGKWRVSPYGNGSYHRWPVLDRDGYQVFTATTKKAAKDLADLLNTLDVNDKNELSVVIASLEVDRRLGL